MNTFTKMYCAFALTLFLYSVGYTQSVPNELARQINRFNTTAFMQHSELLQPVHSIEKSNLQQKYTQYVTASDYFELRPKQLQQLYQQKNDLLTLQLPQINAQDIVLKLMRVKVLSEDFELVDQDGHSLMTEVEIPVFYQGIIEGDNNSLVSINIYSERITGLVANDEGNFTLASLPEEEYIVVFYNSKNLQEQRQFNCGTSDDEAVLYEEETLYSKSLLTDQCVQIHVTCDNSLLELFNNNITHLSNYVYDIFSQSVAIYKNEQINIQLSGLQIWTRPDPFIDNNDASDFLHQFSQQQEDYYNGRLSYLLTGRSIENGVGGIASSLNALCHDFIERPDCNVSCGPYAYNEITRILLLLPDYSLPVFLFSHEIGHLLGSPHTHACKWFSDKSAIDGCGTVEGYCDQPPLPSQNSGTIMSYCHNNVGTRFNNGFGYSPGQLIRQRVANADCLCDCDYNAPAYTTDTDKLKTPHTKDSTITQVAIYDVQSKTTTYEYLENDGNINAAVYESGFNTGIFKDEIDLDNLAKGFSDYNRIPQLEMTYLPYRMLVKLIGKLPGTGINSCHECTGTLIAPNVVLTSGSCIYSQTAQDFFTTMSAYSSYTGAGSCAEGFSQWKDAEAFRLLYFSNWSEDANREYNYGLIILDRPIGAITGWLSPANSLYYNLVNNTFTSMGFPLNCYSGLYAYSASGKFDNVYNESMRTNNDSHTRIEGAPKIIFPNIYGVEAVDPGYSGTYSIRMTDFRVDLINDRVRQYQSSTVNLTPLYTTTESRGNQFGYIGSFSPGESLSEAGFQYLIHNTSKADFAYDPANFFEVKVYLSEDKIITEDDHQIGKFSHFAEVKSLATQWQDFAYNTIVPWDIPTGQFYYVGVKMMINDANLADNTTRPEDVGRLYILPMVVPNNVVELNCGDTYTGNGDDAFSKIDYYECKDITPLTYNENGDGGEIWHKVTLTEPADINIILNDFNNIVVWIDPIGTPTCLSKNQYLENASVGEHYFLVDRLAAGEEYSIEVECISQDFCSTANISNDAIPITCGQTINHTRTIESNRISGYGCDDRNWDGVESIFSINLTDDLTTLNVTTSNSPKLFIYDCTQTTCLATEFKSVDVDLSAGTYYIIAEASSQTFNITAECSSVFIASDACVEERIITSQTPVDTFFQAASIISSTAVIDQPERVTYRASEAIHLNAGFIVKAGSQFLATIGDCLGFDSPNRTVERSFAEAANESSTAAIELKIFPNPARSTTTISLKNIPANNVRLHLFNNTGTLQRNIELPSTISDNLYNFQLNTTPLPNGIYWLRLVTDQEIITHRLIVMN